MGEIIIVKGSDFSGYPDVVNIADLPVVRDGLKGFYTGKGSTTNELDQILSMPPVYGSSNDIYRKISGQTSSPVYPFTGSSSFKGAVIRCVNPANNLVPGLIANTSYDLVDGVSFTFIYWRNGPSTGSNRTIMGIEPLGLQLRVNSTSGLGHLGFLGTTFDIGMHGLVGSASEAITLSFDKNTLRFYRNGSLLSTHDITALGVPDTVEGITSLMSNWTGNSALQGHTVKQIYIHEKVLSNQEVSDIHANLSNLT